LYPALIVGKHIFPPREKRLFPPLSLFSLGWSSTPSHAVLSALLGYTVTTPVHGWMLEVDHTGSSCQLDAGVATGSAPIIYERK